MNGKLKNFLSTKGSSIFAIVAWTALIIGGAVFACFTVILAIAFEAIYQIKNRVHLSSRNNGY